MRILVDRLWPRGLSKDRAAIDHWIRAVSPSSALRRWFNHQPERWPEFKRRYFAELDDGEDGVRRIVDEASRRKVTLLFAAKDARRNNAVALQEYLLQADGRNRPPDET